MSMDSSNLGSTSLSNPMRVTGLASGMNVDQIVQKLMKAESIPLDQMKQKQQILEWQQDDYRSMNSLLLDLNNSAFNMSLQSNLSSTTSSSTDDSLLTAVTSSNSGSATYTMTNATLATAANNISASGIATDTNFDPNASLYAMDNAGEFKNGLTWSTKSVSGETVSVSSDGSKFNLQHGAIDSASLAAGGTITVTNPDSTTTNYTIYTDQASYDAASGTNKVLVDHETGKLTFGQQLKAGSSFSTNYTYKYVSFDLTTYDSSGTANTTSFTFDGSKSLNDIIGSVNASSAGIDMFYDSSTQKVVATRSDTGDLNTSGAEMQFNGSSLFNTTLGLQEANETGGTDASFTLNGLATTNHSNTFTMSGVTFNLKGNISSGQSVTITTATDTDAIYKQIQDFVNKYNDTIKKINDTLSEKKYNNYPPLTADQKSSMSDNDIKLWNEKAQSGMLSNDQILPGGLNQMRIDIYSKVDSVSNSDYNQLAEIGITTSTDYKDNGKLIIDESKLKAAIADDPKAVMQLFTNTSSSNYNDEGIAQRLQTTIQNTMNQVTDKAGNSTMTYVQYYIGQSMNDLDQQITNEQSYLSNVQNRYYSEFTAMEQAIQQSNTQSSYLSKAFG